MPGGEEKKKTETFEYCMIINRAYKYTYSSDTTTENLKNNISGVKS